jgi:hypothetical protein
MKWLALLLAASAATAADLSALIADREAVERVYYNHRTGDKPAFEKTVSREQLRQLVERDLARETALKQRYGLAITDAQVAAEVARIDSTSRAPEVLAQIKAALANDTNRFAHAVARPLVVERLLRARFQEDDALHVSQRRVAESLRASLLAPRNGTNGLPRQVQLLQTSQAGNFTETTWRFGRRPAETDPVGQRGRPAGRMREQYFDELSRDLQDVLRAQLSAAGDVSAVIETPDGFLLFVAKEKTDILLAVAGINIPKRDYDEWVEEQFATKPSK